MTAHQWLYLGLGFVIGFLGLLYYLDPDYANTVSVIMVFIIVVVLMMTRLAKWAWSPRNPKGG